MLKIVAHYFPAPGGPPGAYLWTTYTRYPVVTLSVGREYNKAAAIASLAFTMELHKIHRKLHYPDADKRALLLFEDET